MELVNQVLEDQKGRREHREEPWDSKCGQQLVPPGLKEQKKGLGFTEI